MHFLNIEELVRKLRTYRRQSIVDVGTHLIWEIYQNSLKYTEEQKVITFSFGSKIILLALATTVSHRDKSITTEEFYGFCNAYFNMYSNAYNQNSFDAEKKDIINKLLKTNIIPNIYIDLRYLNDIHTLFRLGRLSASQYFAGIMGLEQLYLCYKIFSGLDETIKRIITSRIMIDPIDFLRSGFDALLLAKQNYGVFDFESKITWDDDYLNRRGVNVETCRLVAYKLSYDEDKLECWYKEEVIRIKEPYQNYFPNLLFRNPIINMYSNSAVTPWPTHHKIYVKF